jgi:hypothetical protein
MGAVASGPARRYLDGWEIDMPALATSANRTRPIVIAAVAIVLALAGTLCLWGYYGTAIFFEMLRNGWAACF